MDEKEPLDVYEHLVQSLDLWIAISWSKLGLTPDIMSGTVRQDLPQAKVAIDFASTLVGILEGRLDEDDRRRVQGIVRDLKINYVQKSREGS